MYLPSPFDLRGRRTLITGSCGLLGYQHSDALLEVGSSLILSDVSEVSLLDQYSFFHDLYPDADIRYFVMDVSSKESI